MLAAAVPIGAVIGGVVGGVIWLLPYFGAPSDARHPDGWGMLLSVLAAGGGLGAVTAAAAAAGGFIGVAIRDRRLRRSALARKRAAAVGAAAGVVVLWLGFAAASELARSTGGGHFGPAWLVIAIAAPIAAIAADALVDRAERAAAAFLSPG